MVSVPSQKEVFETINAQLEEHKIVTFKWLSRASKIHCTIAKEYLEEWIEKSAKARYIITYTVFGRKDNGELLLLLTTDTTEDYFRSKNVTVVKKHVYSIQLSDTSFEPSLIYNIDKSTYELQQMSLSSINYHTEIIRKDPRAVRTFIAQNGSTDRGNANRLQNDIRRVSPRKKNSGPVKNDVYETSPRKNGHIGSNNLRKTSPKKNESEIESQTVSNNQSAKGANTTKPNSSKKSKTNKPVVAITNFFGKGTAVKETRNKPNETGAENRDEIKENSDSKVETKDVDDSDVADVGKKDSKKGPPVKTQEKTKKNLKSAKKNSSKKKGKQLKRIVKALESDSDEESNDSDNNDEVQEFLAPEAEPVDVEEPEPEPRVIAVGGKKRKRKVIEEEGMEDGFMVTIKKVVYESCDSEDESEELPATEEKPVQPTKIESGPPEKKPKIDLLTKKRQSSILSFFQKPKAKT